MKFLNLFRLCAALIFIFLGSAIVFCADNGADEAMIRDIEDHLIAPCCWTQPISQHESGVAEQMRQEVRSMVSAGMSRREIMDHYVAQYGERILATPRPEGFNRLVYILPWVALGFGAWLLFVLLKRLRPPAPAPPRTPPVLDNRYASLIEKELKDLEEN